MLNFILYAIKKISTRSYFIRNKWSQFRVIKHSPGHKYTGRKKKKKKNFFFTLIYSVKFVPKFPSPLLFLLIVRFIYKRDAVLK